jgi:hypothetical protein
VALAALAAAAAAPAFAAEFVANGMLAVLNGSDDN